MNIKYKLLAFLLMISLASCRKDNYITDDELVLAKTQPSILALPSGTAYNTYHGLYIDSTSYILGDTSKENNLLRWCKLHDINTLSFYDLRQVMSGGKAGYLASFLKRAKVQYGIKENTAVIGSDAFITSYLDTFNRSKPDTLQRFNTVNLEKEWWNGDGNFKTYVSILGKLKQWGRVQVPLVRTEEYIGWFLNPSGKELYMANELVKNSDRILVHDYQKTPSFDYIFSRLNNLGQAAKSQGKVFPVVIIFSAEREFSWNYFERHSFEDAYQIIVSGYLSTEFAGKSNIKLVGYQIFDQSYARGVKPIVLL